MGSALSSSIPSSRSWCRPAAPSKKRLPSLDVLGASSTAGARQAAHLQALPAAPPGARCSRRLARAVGDLLLQDAACPDVLRHHERLVAAGAERACAAADSRR
eukprot:5852457-Pyramimonas_sp.AAC.1